MIASFGNGRTEAVFRRDRVPAFAPEVQEAAYRKLMLIHAATVLESLRVPPGNRLEALKGDRAGQHSIRVNRRWRICFRWRDGRAFGVEIVDYHRG